METTPTSNTPGLVFSCWAVTFTRPDRVGVGGRSGFATRAEAEAWAAQQPNSADAVFLPAFTLPK